MQPATLLDVSGAVPEEVVATLLQACKSGTFSKAQGAVANSIADGWPVRTADGHQHTLNAISWGNGVMLIIDALWFRCLGDTRVPHKGAMWPMLATLRRGRGLRTVQLGRCSQTCGIKDAY